MKLALLLSAVAGCGALRLLVCPSPLRSLSLLSTRAQPAMNGASPQDTQKIEAMLEERDGLRRARDFEGADAIRNELRERFNIIIDDQEKTWWVDDGSSRRGEPGRGERERGRGGRASRSSDYTPVGDVADADTARIEALLQERVELRRSRNFDGADAIRDELRFELGVIVDDREQTWWVDNGNGDVYGGARARGGARSRGDRRDGPAGGRDGVDDTMSAQIEAMLQERDELRRQRDFAGADAIRDELRDTLKVVIDDRRKTWWIDDNDTPGRQQGGRNRRSSKEARERDFGPSGHDYTRAEDDGAELAESELNDINELLRRRLEAKLGRDFVEADTLLEELIAMGVQVNDGRKQWRADGGSFDVRPYQRVGGTVREGIDEKIVLSLIAQRIQAKKDREYELADSIQAELAAMGVIVDDVRRTWTSDEAAGYVRVGPPSTKISDAVVAERLIARAVAKRKRDYDLADEIQAEVRAMGIELDNREMTWRYR